MKSPLIKGRGAQLNTRNQYLSKEYVIQYPEGIDEFENKPVKTKVFYDESKGILSKNNSPDMPSKYSINPYQGCEHGCIYCYARNTHPYWGFSAGLDFESKIVVKRNAASLLEREFLNPRWKPAAIMFSGNTDCYQPLERKMHISRSLLEVFLKYRNPVGIITKNALVTKDIDILKKLSALNLVKVFFSINSLDEELRRKLEPRTSSYTARLAAMEQLASFGIPVGAMIAPIIPALNHHEIPRVMKAVAGAGARGVGYTVVRLNGDVGELFTDWVEKNFPDRAEKVLNQIAALHGGKINDTRWGKRMSGDGREAEIISRLFALSKNRYMRDREMPAYDLTIFRKRGMYNLFEQG